MKDLKYLMAYLVPACAILGLSWQGGWSWLTVALVFGILPFIELFTAESAENLAQSAETAVSKRLFFDLLLYANVPLLFGILGGYFWVISHTALSLVEIAGLSISVGIVAGTCGINVAHELGHRTKPWEQTLAQLLLLPSLYQHFFVEHNRGHHKNVGTDKDPASAQMGEHVFKFWVRSVAGSWISAWKLELERLNKSGKSGLSRNNLMLRYSLFQVLWLTLILTIFGWHTFFGAIAVAVVSFLLLETVNYIEHYGLRRRILPGGYPEPVSPRHSWNSDHELGRIFLYELTRHSDHHFKSTRKYQILRHLDESPQLPFGYPTSILLAMIPPLWFKLMDKRVVQVQEYFG